MTVSKSAWLAMIEAYYKHCWPNRKPGGDTVPENVTKMKNIQLVCNDILAELRNTSITSYAGDEDRESQFLSCGQVMMRLFRPVIETLTTTDVDTYVICLDPLGNRRAEKMGTFLSRKKPSVDGVPDYVKLPVHYDCFFADDQPFPGTMDQIFSTPAAKAELYSYITRHLTSHGFRMAIPPNKRVILSGGITYLQTREVATGVIPFDHELMVMLELPYVITTDSVAVVPEMSVEHISEGDVDVWRWVFYYPEKNFMVKSRDGDVFMIGLLKMRRVLQETPGRICWFTTMRGDGSQDATEEETAKALALRDVRARIYEHVLQETGSVHEAYRRSGGYRPASSYATATSSSSSVVTNSRKRPAAEISVRKHVKWVQYYIDLTGIYEDIIDEAHALTTLAGVRDLINPVETYIVALCLSSDAHDYIEVKKATPGVGAHFVWHALHNNIAEIGDMVRVYEMPSILGNTTPVRSLYRYVIDCNALKKLIWFTYLEKARRTLAFSKKNSTEAKLIVAHYESATKAQIKGGVTDADIDRVGSQIAWTLHYWSTGVDAPEEVVSGLSLNAFGEPLYGYCREGWGQTVSSISSRLRCAPPIK